MTESVLTVARRASYYSNLAGSFIALMGLGACSLPSPPIDFLPFSQGSAPTVHDLVDHTSCELAKSYRDVIPIENEASGAELTARQQMWRHLVEDNFVAAVDLTLQVTHNDGFNPSLNFIQPLNGVGSSLPKPFTYSGQGATSSTYNESLAIGLQLSGAQDRNIEQDYQIDMRDLVALYDQYHPTKGGYAAISDVIDKEIKKNGMSRSQFPYCGGPGEDARFETYGSPLQGNLRVAEVLEDGLGALEHAKSYNIYGSSGPSTYSQLRPLVVPAPPGKVGVLAAGGANSQSAPQSSTSGGKTSFGSKIDFSIVWGVNGGPSISLLRFKAGAGSGGGGTGASSGGGGGSGGSGGGGGGPLTFTRSTVDSATFTFGATCSAPIAPETPQKVQFKVGKAPAKLVTASFIIGSMDYETTIEPTSDNAVWPFILDAGHFSAAIVAAQGSLSVKSAGVSQAKAAVQWSGYILDDGRFVLRGTISNLLTGQTAGQIWLEGPSNTLKFDTPTDLPTSLTHFPTNLALSLADKPLPTVDYWSAIPTCDSMTAVQKQNTIDLLTLQNQYQTFFR